MTIAHSTGRVRSGEVSIFYRKLGNRGKSPLLIVPQHRRREPAGLHRRLAAVPCDPPAACPEEEARAELETLFSNPKDAQKRLRHMPLKKE